MGLTFSKSVRFGAVRFNFSGSGIGMSVGIPGLRIGTGPRGAYIGGGVGGFRYRRSLGVSPRSTRQSRVAPNMPAAAADGPSPTVVSTHEHDTLNVLELSDSDSDGLLQSMNEQRSKVPLWPFVAGGLLVLYLSLLSRLMQSWPDAARVAVALTMVGLVGWVYWRDNMRKLTVLFFEPDAATSERFEALCHALSTAASAQKLRAVVSTSRYADRKYSAGASQGLKLSPAGLRLGQGPGVAANVEVPILKTGRTTLAFYPDRVLAFQGNSVGGVTYGALAASERRSQFIEEESVPPDATVIGRTWRYVNRDGGPDRRFKNNRELPVCAYSELILSTSSGLDIRIQGSRERGFESFAAALTQMA